MQQFLLDNLSSSYPFSGEFEDKFGSLSLNDFDRSRISGSLPDSITPKTSLLPSKSKQCMLGSSELRVLAELFAKLNTNARNVVVNIVHKKYTSIQLHGNTYGSSGNRPSSCPYVVLTFWNELYYGPPLTTLPHTASHPNSHEHPVNIHYYVTVTCTCTNSNR